MCALSAGRQGPRTTSQSRALSRTAFSPGCAEILSSPGPIRTDLLVSDFAGLQATDVSAALSAESALQERLHKALKHGARHLSRRCCASGDLQVEALIAVNALCSNRRCSSASSSAAP